MSRVLSPTGSTIDQLKSKYYTEAISFYDLLRTQSEQSDRYTLIVRSIIESCKILFGKQMRQM